MNEVALRYAALLDIGRRATEALVRESGWTDAEEYGVLVELNTTEGLLVELDVLRLAAQATGQADEFNEKFSKALDVSALASA
jgi:hypothetical protein